MRDGLALRVLAPVPAIVLAAAAAVAYSRGAFAPAVALAFAAPLAPLAAIAFAGRRARDEARRLSAALDEERGAAAGVRAWLHDAQATLLGVAGQLEMRTAELDEANRHFALALQGSNDGVWEYDLRTRQLYLSPGFRERLGIEPGEDNDLFGWYEEHLHPEDAERWRQAVREHLAEHVSYNMDLRLRTPSGDYRWFRARGSAEWGFTGKPVRMSGSLTDITERRFAEARMRESEENFRSLSAASPVGILKADAFGLCEYCNGRWQQITGLTEFEAMGEGWIDSVDTCDRERVLERWMQYVCGSGAFDEQFRVLSPDGGRRWVHSRANAVRDDDGLPNGFVVTIEDVTGEKQVAAELADARDKAMEAAQAKSEFLANMSHEIRTPLNGVIGMSELLAGTELDEEQRDHVRTINTSADALLAIINDILDFSKIEAGKMNIERVDYDLRSLHEDVAEMLAPRARERGLELVLAVEPALPRRVLGDPTRIRQILLNLVSNAIKFTETGEVELSARPVQRGGDSRLELRVRDTGIGIPEERLAAVFDSFTQADGSTTRKYGGTGLGLTICRQLARLMGGTIHVASEAGVGSQFWVDLPLEPSPRNADEKPCDLAGAVVLVVDDHPVNRRILAGTLRAWGAKPEAVESGEAAIGRLGRPGAARVDLVLMDYLMPGLDGMETARRLRALPGAERRVVLMTSVMAAPAGLAAEIGPEHAVEQWLTRPIRESSLARVLARALGRVHAQAQVAQLSEAAEDFSPLSILLVDDNEVNRKVAQRMLQRLGANATVAVNGAEAVRRIAERDYDVVFMDCQMPELDGFEATRVVRARERAAGGHVRIVAMTANAMEGDREACLEAGMDDYVAKPVKLDALLAQLRLAAALRGGGDAREAGEAA